MKNEKWIETHFEKKATAFAIRIVKLSQFLQSKKNEFVLAKQVLRSGTAIGALIREAQFGQTKADFANKMSIALKEANETDYWLNLLRDTEFISESQFDSIHPECNELIAMLVSTVKTSKRN